MGSHRRDPIASREPPAELALRLGEPQLGTAPQEAHRAGGVRRRPVAAEEAEAQAEAGLGVALLRGPPEPFDRQHGVLPDPCPVEVPHPCTSRGGEAVAGVIA